MPTAAAVARLVAAIASVTVEHWEFSDDEDRITMTVRDWGTIMAAARAVAPAPLGRVDGC